MHKKKLAIFCWFVSGQPIMRYNGLQVCNHTCKFSSEGEALEQNKIFIQLHFQHPLFVVQTHESIKIRHLHIMK